MQVNRRLYRCREDRVLAGVAAGVAEFFDLDPTLVRVLWFLSIFAGGFSILLYLGLCAHRAARAGAAGHDRRHTADRRRRAGRRVIDTAARGAGSGRLTMFIGYRR